MARRGSQSFWPAAGVTEGWVSAVMGAGDETHVLCNSSQDSSLLNHPSRSWDVFILAILSRVLGSRFAMSPRVSLKDSQSSIRNHSQRPRSCDVMIWYVSTGIRVVGDWEPQALSSYSDFLQLKYLCVFPDKSSGEVQEPKSMPWRCCTVLGYQHSQEWQWGLEMCVGSGDVSVAVSQGCQRWVWHH